MENLALTLVRVFVPLLIFRWPFWGILVALYIDASDWHLYQFRAQEDYVRYQIWDKLLDTYYLSIAFFTSLFWKDIRARAFSIFLFLYRTVGIVLFILLGNGVFLFLFPNVFENFFLFYLLYRLVSKSDQLFLPGELGLMFLFAISVPKIGRAHV